MIFRDYFQENRTSPRPFLLLRISFPGRPIFIQFVPGPRVVVGDEGVDGGGADGDLLDGAEHSVEEAGHDGRVEAVLKKKATFSENLARCATAAFKIAVVLQYFSVIVTLLGPEEVFTKPNNILDL